MVFFFSSFNYIQHTNNNLLKNEIDLKYIFYPNFQRDKFVENEPNF